MPAYIQAVPVGTIIDSMLTETQIQNNYGTAWILCDGRNVAGSKYASITGSSTVPDLRGRYTRAKDNGSGNDTNGDSSLGTYRANQNAQHSHGVTDPGHVHGVARSTGAGAITAASGAVSQSAVFDIAAGSNTTGISINNQGGADVQPESIVVNKFVKIN